MSTAIAPAVSQPSLRRTNLVAGLGLLLMAILAVPANFLVVEGIYSPGDAAATGLAAREGEGMLRFGILCLIGVVILDFIVAAAIVPLFTPVSGWLTNLAAWLRVAYGVVFMVAITNLTAALRSLDDDEAVLLAFESFDSTWDASLLIFGAHLLLLGALALRSGFVPIVIGALLTLAGVGYFVDAVGPLVSASYTISLTAIAFIGEVGFLFWLLVTKRR